jgi:predicted deacylase
LSILQVGPLRAESGQKASGYCYAPVGMADIRLPVVLIHGRRPGPRLALTAGIHSSEFLGVESLRSLLRAVDPTRLKGQIVACPLAHPPSTYGHRLSNSPLDDIDPNRVFPGNPAGKPTERMVAWLFENLIRGSDVFIDLHSGGLSEGLVPHTAYRTSGNDAQDRRGLELADVFGLADVVRGKTASGGNSHAAATREQIVGLLVEAGQLGVRSPEMVAQVRDGILRVMEKIGMIDQSLPALKQAPRHWTWVAEVESTLEGLWYPEFEIGDDIHEGAVLGRIVDPLDNLLATIVAPASGRVMYGERGLMIGCGDILAAIAERED